MQVSTPFKLEEEKDKKVRVYATQEKLVAICVVAPFAGVRVTPKLSVTARFSYPDEFVLEEFIEKIHEAYPKKENRPPLHILIHSPGGSVSSSFMAARVLRSNFDRIVGFIPHIAASGATVMALSCNEIVMGDISRLTGIDPYYEMDDEVVYPLSIVRAFDTLESILGTKSLEEISYPYRHLVQSISAQEYDEAAHTLAMVEGYARELMSKAGYKGGEIRKVINGILYDINSHEEVITLDRAKAMGIKAKHFREDESTAKCWKVMKNWLRNYLLTPSPVHIIRYCIPEPKRDEELKKTKGHKEGVGS